MGKYIYRAVLAHDEDGGYDTEVPTLPGCVSYGQTYLEAISMAADAAKTYVASLLADGEAVPLETCCEGDGVFVCFEVDESYIVHGETVSAAEAARRLGVSPSRVTRMIDAGILDGYRRGRHTCVTVESIERRLALPVKGGRPRASAAL